MAKYFIVGPAGGGNLSGANTLSLADDGVGTNTLSDLVAADELGFGNTTPNTGSTTGGFTFAIDEDLTVARLFSDATDTFQRTLRTLVLGTVNLSVTGDIDLGASGTVFNNTFGATTLGGNLTLDRRAEMGEMTITGASTYTSNTVTSHRMNRVVTINDGASITGGINFGMDFRTGSALNIGVGSSFTSASVSITYSTPFTISNDGAFTSRLSTTGNNLLTLAGAAGTWSDGGANDGWQTRQIDFGPYTDFSAVAFRIAGNGTLTLPATFQCRQMYPFLNAVLDLTTNNTVLTTEIFRTGLLDVASSTTPVTVTGSGDINSQGGKFPAVQYSGSARPRTNVSYTSVRWLNGGSLVPYTNLYTITSDTDITFDFGSSFIDLNNVVAFTSDTISFDGQDVKNTVISATNGGTATAAGSFENVDATGGQTIVAIGATNVDGNTDGAGFANGPAPDNNNIQFAAAVSARSRQPLGVF